MRRRREAQRAPTLKERGLRRLEITADNPAFDLDERTYVMGILNCTPDSFSDGGKYIEPDDAVRRAFEMAADGADIIDIGGESTRPGSSPVSAGEELRRVIPVIERLRGKIDIPVSIDTSKAEVAEAALKLGASIVNDITGLKADPAMAAVIARYRACVVVVHIKGEPGTMQEDLRYGNLIPEIIAGLRDSVSIAERAGCDTDKIIIDPGIGFGKTAGDNLRIIKNLSQFKPLGHPIMIGVSRKSFIGEVLNCAPDGRLMGTASSAALAIANGADIIRVHDVKEMTEVARVADSICRA